MAMRKKPFCRPLEQGGTSETKSVAKQLSATINALSWIDASNVDGEILGLLGEMGDTLRRRLRAEGWIVRVNTKTDKWEVLPAPKTRVYSLHELELCRPLDTAQHSDLKIDAGDWRVWLSPTGTVTVEERRKDKWEIVKTYQAKGER